MWPYTDDTFQSRFQWYVGVTPVILFGFIQPPATNIAVKLTPTGGATLLSQHNPKPRLSNGATPQPAVTADALRLTTRGQPGISTSGPDTHPGPMTWVGQNLTLAPGARAGQNHSSVPGTKVGQFVAWGTGKVPSWPEKQVSASWSQQGRPLARLRRLPDRRRFRRGWQLRVPREQQRRGKDCHHCDRRNQRRGSDLDRAVADHVDTLLQSDHVDAKQLAMTACRREGAVHGHGRVGDC